MHHALITLALDILAALRAAKVLDALGTEVVRVSHTVSLERSSSCVTSDIGCPFLIFRHSSKCCLSASSNTSTPSVEDSVSGLGRFCGVEPVGLFARMSSMRCWRSCVLACSSRSFDAAVKSVDSCQKVSAYNHKIMLSLTPAHGLLKDVTHGMCQFLQTRLQLIRALLHVYLQIFIRLLSFLHNSVIFSKRVCSVGRPRLLDCSVTNPVRRQLQLYLG